MRSALVLLLVVCPATLRAEPPASVAAVRASHWSFRSVTKPALPAIKNGTWGRTPVDAFVLARLEAQGFAPAPEADRRTLLRRLSIDLTGLPPTPKEVEEARSDKSPE